MIANVIPFPLSRRVAFGWRHADIINGLEPRSAERHLAHQLEVQREALERRGVDPERIDREVASLERAILAASEGELVANEQ
jgi:hypothetical protein